jgi:hypothetical protein
MILWESVLYGRLFFPFLAADFARMFSKWQQAARPSQTAQLLAGR